MGGCIKKKHLISIFCLTVGAASALGVGYWPGYAVVIQMALYTVIVFGPLFLGLWPARNRRIFWGMMSAAVVVHGLFLYMIRALFPFSTVLIVLPIALAEAAAIFVAMDKSLGDRSVEHPE
ncbi:MAG TPA: hypothetical protein VMV57_12570 [Terracidiphilus sp.]|nr:hypothetical protein [Terracidiphilus sp.]